MISKQSLTSCVENAYAKTWLEDGIVMVWYKPNLKTITIDVAVLNVADRLAVTGDTPRPCLIFTNGTVTADRASREYFAKEDGIKNLSAGALIVENYLSKMVGNLFLSEYMPFKKTKIPTKLFMPHEKEKAIRWLRNYIPDRMN